MVTDANGCLDSNTMTINEPPAITTSITGTDAPCNNGNGGSADLTVAGGTPSYTYFWSNFQTTEDATNLSAGTYAVMVIDDNGCFEIDSVTIDEPTHFHSNHIYRTALQRKSGWQRGPHGYRRNFSIQFQLVTWGCDRRFSRSWCRKLRCHRNGRKWLHRHRFRHLNRTRCAQFQHLGN